MIREEKYVVKADKVADKKFEDLKKQSFGYEPASERRTEPVIKYLAKQLAEQEEKKEPEAAKLIEPKGFIGLEDDETIALIQKNSKWDPFSKKGFTADIKPGLWDPFTRSSDSNLANIQMQQAPKKKEVETEESLSS